MAEIEKRYWDSSVFLASIKNEPGRADEIENILGDARAGRCEIYTSVITLTEVVKRRPKENPIDPQTEATITAFFKNVFIKPVPVDVAIATRARRLIWDFPWLSARDAIHIATAIQLGIGVIEHYDDDDIGKVGERVKRDKLAGFPEIRHPKWSGQLPLAKVPATPSPGPAEPAHSSPASERRIVVEPQPEPSQREAPPAPKPPDKGA